MRSIPQHCTPTTQKELWNKSGSCLFRLVSVLGCGNSLVGGRVQFDSLLLRTDQTNTHILVEVSG